MINYAIGTLKWLDQRWSYYHQVSTSTFNSSYNLSPYKKRLISSYHFHIWKSELERHKWGPTKIDAKFLLFTGFPCFYFYKAGTLEQQQNNENNNLIAYLLPNCIKVYLVGTEIQIHSWILERDFSSENYLSSSIGV